jgi:hypothetical protein
VRNAQSACGQRVVGGLTQILGLDRLVDNLSFDENGALWAAGIPNGLRFLSAYHDFEKVAPSTAFRITKNVGKKAFFGKKLKVEKVWHLPTKRKEMRQPRIGIRR